MRLLLVRHGRTHSNVHHLLDTAAPGADLDEVGREQAAALPGRLAGEDIGAINVSTLVRTQQTAAPYATATGMPVTVLNGLHEVQAGIFEGQSQDSGFARILYALIDTRQPYNEAEAFKTTPRSRERQHAQLLKQAQSLGFQLVPAA